MRLTCKLSIPSTAKVLLLKIQTCYMNMTVSGWALCILEVDVSLCDTVSMSDFFFQELRLITDVLIRKQKSSLSSKSLNKNR
jgi:hypothetical protein